MTKTGDSEVKALQPEIRRLKKELAYESLRADAFNELINVAEKQFNISIRKKSWRQAVKNLHAENSRHYRVSSLCTLLGVTKQSYCICDEARLLETKATVGYSVYYIRE